MLKFNCARPVFVQASSKHPHSNAVHLLRQGMPKSTVTTCARHNVPGKRASFQPSISGKKNQTCALVQLFPNFSNPIPSTFNCRSQQNHPCAISPFSEDAILNIWIKALDDQKIVSSIIAHGSPGVVSKLFYLRNVNRGWGLTIDNTHLLWALLCCQPANGLLGGLNKSEDSPAQTRPLQTILSGIWGTAVLQWRELPGSKLIENQIWIHVSKILWALPLQTPALLKSTGENRRRSRRQ